MDVSKNSGTPKSSILIGFPIIDHPFWGSPIFGNTHMAMLFFPIFNILQFTSLHSRELFFLNLSRFAFFVA